MGGAVFGTWSVDLVDGVRLVVECRPAGMVALRLPRGCAELLGDRTMIEQLRRALGAALVVAE